MDAAEEIAPDPGKIVESLRDFGYTLPTALADLIDNSITAGARSIRVEIMGATSGSSRPSIVVVDDGHGMNTATLVEAMRLGTTGPQAQREDSDLGRFGLGLKTAALSQGRCLTVVSKTTEDREPTVRRWDLGHIQRKNRWELIRTPTRLAEEARTALATKPSGTAVVIEELDRPSFLQVPQAERQTHLASALNSVRRHLAMVFHRFLENGLSIQLGETDLAPWDPFLRPKSTPDAPEVLQPGAIAVAPFVLPHHSKLTDEEHERAAGPDGWNAHQGFYIYRCERLIVPGTWLNLGLKKEEHYKLARIRVDLPNTEDTAWHLNVMKSSVAAPAGLRADVKRIAQHTRRVASEVYRHRGERKAPTTVLSPERYVWKKIASRRSVKYRIERTHPVVQALLHAGCDHAPLLKEALSLVETTLPVASMLQDQAKAIDGSGGNDQLADVQQYLPMVRHAEQFLIRAGLSPTAARKKVLACEPFAAFRDELDQEMGKENCGI